MKPSKGKYINKILTIHAEWLEEIGYYEQAKECFKQAKECSKQNDSRQINGRNKNETTKLHASSD